MSVMRVNMSNTCSEINQRKDIALTELIQEKLTDFKWLFYKQTEQKCVQTDVKFIKSRLVKQQRQEHWHIRKEETVWVQYSYVMENL